MSGTTRRSRLTVGLTGSITRELVVQFNKLVGDVERVAAAVNTIAGKLDGIDLSVSDFASAAGLSTSAHLSAARIGDDSGSVYG